MDTWLAAGGNAVNSPAGHSARHLRDEQVINYFNETSSKTQIFQLNGQKPISSTISRFACRVLAEREHPHRVFIYAAGFDSSRNIFLGEKATKWQKKNGEFDGLTTNGVLVLHPNWCTDEQQKAVGQEEVRIRLNKRFILFLE